MTRQIGLEVVVLVAMSFSTVSVVQTAPLATESDGSHAGSLLASALK